MALIEQAIFTSAETDRGAGYQIVAASPGVWETDSRELAAWGPSHDSLIDSGPDAVSFNFHPLPTGAFCVSRTTSGGWEYSGRGTRVYTQCLIVPAEELARFGNNPFAVLRAALAGGELEVHREIPKQLAPLRLSGRSASVDSTLLARLRTQPGPLWMGAVVQAALSTPCVMLSGTSGMEHVVAGLVNCLPPECRTELSFSTGLKYSPRRPFRLSTVAADPAEHRRAARQHGATVLDLSKAPPTELTPLDGWGRFVEQIIASRRTSFLTTQFAKRRFGLTLADLPALGLQLMEEFDAAVLPAPPSGKPARPKQEEPSEPRDWLDGLQQAHAAHRRFQGSASLAATNAPKATPPIEHLNSNSPEVLEQLERLDDLVFEAIGGNREALDQLRETWPKLPTELGRPLLDESREQYLRHALSIWEDARDGAAPRDPARAAQALDVLCILFENA